MSSDKSPKPAHLRLISQDQDIDTLESDDDDLLRDTLVEDITPEFDPIDPLEMLPVQRFDRGVILQEAEATERRRYFLILDGLAELRFLEGNGSFSKHFEHLKKDDVIGVACFAEVRTSSRVNVRVIDLDEIDRLNHPVLTQRAYALILSASFLAGNIARQDAERHKETTKELETALEASMEYTNGLADSLEEWRQRSEAAERKTREIDALAKETIRTRIEELLKNKFAPMEQERDELALRLRSLTPWLIEFFSQWPQLQDELGRLRKDQKADTTSVVNTLQIYHDLVESQGAEIDQLQNEVSELREHFAEYVYPVIQLLLDSNQPELQRWAVRLLDELYTLRLPIGHR